MEKEVVTRRVMVHLDKGKTPLYCDEGPSPNHDPMPCRSLMDDEAMLCWIRSTQPVGGTVGESSSNVQSVPLRSNVEHVFSISSTDDTESEDRNEVQMRMLSCMQYQYEINDGKSILHKTRFLTSRRMKIHTLLRLIYLQILVFQQ